MSDPPAIVDFARAAAARSRAARRFPAHDFLHRRALADIADRLALVTRRFERALFVGAGGLGALVPEGAQIGRIIFADPSMARIGDLRPGVVFDAEKSPVAPGSVDLIVSLLTLHRANDLVGALVQHRLALRPGGLFLAALFGEETLGALRRALLTAEMNATGGASPRIAPFAGVKDLGAALQRAGFVLPVADVDRVEVAYRDLPRLIADLRGMGETGALARMARPLTREIFAAAAGEFAAAGGTERFDIVFLTGWARD